MDTVLSRSPQNPSDIVITAARNTPDEVVAAIAHARRAQREWWALGAAGRANALHAAAEALNARATEATDLVVREVGKPISEARGEVGRGVAILRYYAQTSYLPKGDMYPPSMGTMLWSERRPRGVAGLITPWNFPVAIPLWKAAPALAAGNAVVIKPSTDAIACALFLKSILDPFLPQGLVQVVIGGRDVANAVIDNADVMSFTGSTAVGQQVAARSVGNNIPVQAEMGGQNPAVVLADADFAKTASLVAGAAMWFAGQKCTATRRVIVVGDRDFAPSLIEAVQALKVGDPADASVTVGPLINEASLGDFATALANARAAGATVLTGGGEPDGNFVQPLVLDGLAADHPLSCEETFGPIVTLHRAADIDEAMAMANSVRYGLVTSLHGRDINALTEMAAQAHSGLVKINASTSGVDFYAPFGGEKASSYGQREQGLAALDFYSQTVTTTLAPH